MHVDAPALEAAVPFLFMSGYGPGRWNSIPKGDSFHVIQYCVSYLRPEIQSSAFTGPSTIKISYTSSCLACSANIVLVDLSTLT
jgi:hypothetical protein